MAEVRAKLAPGAAVEVWFQDEMRVGQKNKLTYRWARKGSRPRAAHDQRTQSTYLFGAVCPEHGTGAALVLPFCNTEARFTPSGASWAPLGRKATADKPRMSVVMVRLLVLIGLVVIFVADSVAAAERRVALVVGASNYAHAGALAHTLDDARGIAAALTRLEFDVDLVLNPDRAALENAVRRLGQNRAARMRVSFISPVTHSNRKASTGCCRLALTSKATAIFASKLSTSPRCSNRPRDLRVSR